MQLSSYVACLCQGHLQHQASRVVGNAAHDIQAPGSPRHHKLVLPSASPPMALCQAKGFCRLVDNSKIRATLRFTLKHLKRPSASWTRRSCSSDGPSAILPRSSRKLLVSAHCARLSSPARSSKPSELEFQASLHPLWSESDVPWKLANAFQAKAHLLDRKTMMSSSLEFSSSKFSVFGNLFLVWHPGAL